MIKKTKFIKSKLVAASIAFFGFASATWAQDYPNRAVTLVVSYPAGGTLDAVARVIAPQLGKILGEGVVVLNKGGASGAIAESYVARSKPDGYTILLDASNYTQNAVLRSNLGFDPIKDLTPISALLTVPNILVSSSKSNFKSINDVISQGKAPHNNIDMASSGVGSGQYLAGLLFNRLAGTKIQQVTYSGGGQALVDVLSGRIPLMFITASAPLPYIRSGALRALAVGDTERLAVLPDVPTVSESAVPGFVSNEWHAIFVPTGTPAPIINKLSAAFSEIVRDTSIAKTLTDLGCRISDLNTAKTQVFVRKEISNLKDLAQRENLKLE
ncbi:Bug family tripartite tricarboxylate transporter substrate binding protein [Candidimonas nitroreducens]|uniref:LacI family transcriptional regulator n=1 Tax=Candidimonas nitroreducens TaxID=683354 RepID=A0A225MR80_9BURK|nr:tripartite tricarboxylate transporter substrate-binding protein [Candidimonas nitroreducens]OWT61971.1 LacI family transcriptional regulator [Candidimonas nitroreducens]